jgi:hypothetical protein
MRSLITSLLGYLISVFLLKKLVFNVNRINYLHEKYKHEGRGRGLLCNNGLIPA